MARISCPCGASINLHQIPNSRGFRLIWEPLIEQLINNLVDSHKQSGSLKDFEKQVSALLYGRKPRFPEMYECSNCGRLAVFVDNSTPGLPLWFKPDRADQDGVTLISDLIAAAEGDALNSLYGVGWLDPKR